MEVPNFNNWQVIGLTFNIVGAFFIVNSLVFKRPRRILQEHFGVEKRRSLASIRNYVMSQVQLVIGFVFLIAGYFLELADHLASELNDRDEFAFAPSVLEVAALLLLSMAVVTLVLKVCQIFWTKWTFRRILLEFFRDQPWALDKHPQIAREVAEILGVEQKKEDSIGDFMGRLKKYLDVDASKAAPPPETPMPRGRTAPPQAAPPASPMERHAPRPHPATPPRILS